MHYVTAYSSGAGSYAAALRTEQTRQPTDTHVLVFSDVGSTDGGDCLDCSGSGWQDHTRPAIGATCARCSGAGILRDEHDGEDADNYRFLRESALDLNLPLVILRDGRSIWQVFADKRFLGNARLANCSHELKQKPFREWLEQTYPDPDDVVVVVGIDWSEESRVPAIVRNYLPYKADAPLTRAPYVDKSAVLAGLRARGIEPPRLYRLGMAHANCGGGCVRAGQGAFVHLLEVMPERFAAWEANEERMRAHLGRDDVAILNDRTRAGRLAWHNLTEDDVEEVPGDNRNRTRLRVKATGVVLPNAVPLPLTELRARHGRAPAQLDLLDVGGCGCFVQDDPDT